MKLQIGHPSLMSAPVDCIKYVKCQKFHRFLLSRENIFQSLLHSEHHKQNKDYISLLTFMEALEESGMPFSYFPVMIPHASGDHVIAPTPVTMETIGR